MAGQEAIKLYYQRLQASRVTLLMFGLHITRELCHTVLYVLAKVVCSNYELFYIIVSLSRLYGRK